MKKQHKKQVVSVKEKPNYFNLAIEVLFLFFLFLMPVIFDRRIGIVFSLTKTTFMYLTMVVLLSLWSIKILITRQAGWVHSALGWPIVSYLLSCTVATITSVHVYTSLVGFYGRYEGLITLYIYGLCAFIVINYFRAYPQIKRIAGVVLISSSIMGVYGIIQRLGIDPYAWGGVVTWYRVIATIGQPNFLAAYMDMAFMLVLFLFLLDKPLPDKKDLVDWKKYWFEQLSILAYFIVPVILFVVMIYNLGINAPFVWYLGFILMGISALFFVFSFENLHPYVQNSIYFINLMLSYICLLNTISRGGYLGILVGGVLFGIFIGRQRLLKEWKKLLLLLLVLAAFSAAYMLNPQFSPLERFAGEIKIGKIRQVEEKPTQEGKGAYKKVELGGAAGSRGETWKSAFHIIADRPLFGIGPEVLKMVFPRYETDLFRFRETFHVKQDRCHNSIFDVNVTRGMISFFLYAWLLFTVFKAGISGLGRASPQKRLLIAAVLAGVVAYKIQNQFSFGVVAIGSLYWVLMGMVISLSKDKTQEDKAVPFKLEELPWLPLAGTVLVAVFLIYLGVQPFMADLYYKRGKTLSERQLFREAVDQYKKSLKHSPYEGGVRTHYSIAYLNMIQRKGLNPKNAEEVAGLFREAMAIDPYNADNLHVLGKIYLIEDQLKVAGALDKSIEYSKKALKTDPYYAEVWENLGLAYERKGDLDKALESYKNAFMINPNLSAPMERLVNLLGRMGQISKAETVFEEALQRYADFIPVRYNLGNIYMRLGKTKKALEQFQAILALDEKQVPALLKLGELYFKIGEVKKAQAFLYQVFLIDPENIEAHNGLGVSYLRMGQKQKARQEFEQVLMLAPQNAYAKQMLERIK